MNLRKSILALSVVAGIVAAPMTVFAAHTHSWGSPQYYGYEDEMPGIYDDWDKCATRHVYNYKQCLTQIIHGSAVKVAESHIVTVFQLNIAFHLSSE